MKYRHWIAACLIVLAPSYAFARGGGGGSMAIAFGMAIQAFIFIALIIGSLSPFSPRKIIWITLACFFILLVAVSIINPFLGFLAGFTMPFAIPVFVSLSYALRNVFRTTPVSSKSPTVTDCNTATQKTKSKYWIILHWIAATYAFWVAVSLINFYLLAFLIISPAIPFLIEPTIGKYLPFLLPPLGVAITTGAIVTIAAAKYWGVNRYIAPFVFNACVFIAFLISAQIYRGHLMSQSLIGHTPTNLEKSFFLDDVIKYGALFRDPHASFTENGKTYNWSYSERKFFLVP